MVKICPIIINFLFFAQKKKYYPEKKSVQIFEKFTQKIKICPVTESSEDDEFSECTLLSLVLSRWRCQVQYKNDCMVINF